MQIVLVPEPGDQIAQAVELALQRAGLDPAAEPASYRSAWRQAALAEGADRGAEHTERTPGAPVRSRASGSQRP